MMRLRTIRLDQQVALSNAPTRQTIILDLQSMPQHAKACETQ